MCGIKYAAQDALILSYFIMQLSKTRQQKKHIDFEFYGAAKTNFEIVEPIKKSQSKAGSSLNFNLNQSENCHKIKMCVTPMSKKPPAVIIKWQRIKIKNLINRLIGNQQKLLCFGN